MGHVQVGACCCSSRYADASKHWLCVHPVARQGVRIRVICNGSFRDSGNGTVESNNDDGGGDDDLIEITDTRTSSIRAQEQTPSAIRTPPLSSRGGSVVSASTPRTNKRPHVETIDLTLSDDDDDGQPAAKIKRPSVHLSDSFRPRPPLDPYRFQLAPPRSHPPPPDLDGF